MFDLVVNVLVTERITTDQQNLINADQQSFPEALE